MLFWIGLAVMTSAAVAAVLVPLSRPPRTHARSSASDLAVYRDQLGELDAELHRGLVDPAEAESARVEIARRMLAAGESGRAHDVGAMRMRPVALALAVAVPAVALGLYLALGSPGLPGQPLADRLAAPIEGQDVETLIRRVEARLAEAPEDGRGWEVLASVYSRTGRHADAARAWQNAIRLLGATFERQQAYGEAVVAREDGLVTAEALDAFRAAAEAEPDAARPRFYLAMAAEQDGDWARAAAMWRELVEDAPADAEWREVATERLAAAEAQIGAQPALSAEDLEAAAATDPDARAEAIAGMVERLSARLAEDGDDLDGWLRLARAHAVMGEAERAREALAAAREHFPDDAAAERIDAAARALDLES